MPVRAAPNRPGASATTRIRAARCPLAALSTARQSAIRAQARQALASVASRSKASVVPDGLFKIVSPSNQSRDERRDEVGMFRNNAHGQAMFTARPIGRQAHVVVE